MHANFKNHCCISKKVFLHHNNPYENKILILIIKITLYIHKHNLYTKHSYYFILILKHILISN